jgi:formylglycine-generating enzyme
MYPEQGFMDPKTQGRQGPLWWPVLPLLVLAACANAPTHDGGESRQDGVRFTGAAPGPAPSGMKWIPGGTFTMGSNDDTLAWPEERPAHRVAVSGFWMDSTEVTNARFLAFVEATGYVTDAERPPLLEEVMGQLPPGSPEPDASQLVPGSLVFTPSDKPLHDCRYLEWWTWTHGADWRHPEGPGSDIATRMDHPVVHVSWNDAVAYCTWAGGRLPAEAEWERAARGGVDNAQFEWGDEAPSDTFIKCNSWQGDFPRTNSAADGYPGTAPVARFAANGFGLYDMAGNVWEWCQDHLDMTLYAKRAGSRVIDPQGPTKSFDPERPYEPLRAQRGGSFLCHDTYCWRYRPSARQGTSPETGMSHVGFRCVRPGSSTSHTR